MEYKPKLNEKCTPILHCVSNFEGTSYTVLQDTASMSFISCCFPSAFTSADIIFYNFMELYSTFSDFLLQMFLF